MQSVSGIPGRRGVVGVAVRMVAGFLISLSAALPPSAAAAHSDEELRSAQLGTWAVPSDSSDLSSVNRYARETFRDNGTVTTYFYAAPNCEKLIRAIDQHWSIRDGVETSVVDATGFTMRDKILAYDDRRMTILSLDDGTTYTRERAEACGAPTS